MANYLNIAKNTTPKRAHVDTSRLFSIEEAQEESSTAIAVQERPKEQAQGAQSTVTRIKDGEVQQLPVSALYVPEIYARARTDKAAEDSMQLSVERFSVQVPVIVAPPDPNAIGNLKGKYRIVKGKRRWNAAVRAGLETIPCIVRRVDDLGAQRLHLMLQLNTQALDAIDRGRALIDLRQQMQEESNRNRVKGKRAKVVSWQEVAAEVGLSRASMDRLRQLTKLPSDIVGELRAGTLSQRQVIALRAISDPVQKKVLSQAAIIHDLTSDEIAAIARMAVNEKLAGEELLNRCEQVKKRGLEAFKPKRAPLPQNVFVEPFKLQETPAQDGAVPEAEVQPDMRIVGPLRTALGHLQASQGQLDAALMLVNNCDFEEVSRLLQDIENQQATLKERLEKLSSAVLDSAVKETVEA